MVVEVLTSWNTKDSTSLQGKVRVFSDLLQKNAIDYIDDTTYFNLIKPDASDPADCDIRILFKPKNKADYSDVPDSVSAMITKGAQVNQIILFSEAKLVEVYTGAFEEYSQSIRSEFLTLNDSSMWKTVVSLNPPQKFIKLQLKGLQSSNSTCIHGILLNISLMEAKAFPVSLPISAMSHKTQNIGSATFMMEALKCFSSFKDLDIIESRSKEHARSFSKESLGKQDDKHNTNDLQHQILIKMDEMEKNLVKKIDLKFEHLHKKIDMKFANVESLLEKLTES